jgi:hypothetical protein
MATNASAISIDINNTLKQNYYPGFHYPIRCTFRRFKRCPQAQAEEKEQVIDNIMIDLNNSGSLIDIDLRLIELEEIRDRYRLSLRLVDRRGFKLKSGKAITLTNRGLIQYDRPENLNTLYVILDYDVPNNVNHIH